MNTPQYIPSFYFYKFANAIADPYTSLQAYGAGAIDDESTHIIDVHAAHTQRATGNVSGGGDTKDAGCAGDCGGRGDVGDGGRCRT